MRADHLAIDMRPDGGPAELRSAEVRWVRLGHGTPRAGSGRFRRIGPAR
jgi:hypothetical protein